jgi:CHRD domain
VRRRIQLAAAVALVAVLAVVGAAIAGGGGHKISEKLTGYEETPMTISTPGKGEFKARISRFGDEIRYRLSYRDLESAVTQAHIHFGASATSGGISVWLCGNNPPVTNTPPGTQPCPPQPATITGEIGPEDIVGPTGQGIEVGAFDEFVDALEAGVTYANVHTVNRGGGEIRAQLDDDGKHRGHGGRD